MLRNLHLGLANGLPNVAVVVILLDILYGVALVNSYILYYFIVKFDGVGGLKGSKEVVVAAGIRRSVVSAARSWITLCLFYLASYFKTTTHCRDLILEISPQPLVYLAHTVF